jgi:sulfatase maturation enzyme AslB (radical SAM superfamily)
MTPNNKPLKINGDTFIAMTNKELCNPEITMPDRGLQQVFCSPGRSIYPTDLERGSRFSSALLHNINKNLKKGYLCPDTLKKQMSAFLGDTSGISLIQEKTDQCPEFFTKQEQRPPVFFVLSPTNRCNLRCIGCPGIRHEKSLSYEALHHMISDIRDNYGDRFIVIQGGEPFIYTDSGKTLFDIFKEFRDLFFIVITNGTLIDEKLTLELAQLGNVCPLISVDGYEMETDKKRGSGVHGQMLKAMENLRGAGLAFGIMVTVTEKNINLMLDDFFYDHYFEEQGAMYMWQSLTISVSGEKGLPGLVPSPEKRMGLYRTRDKIMREKKYCVADFWNSNITAEACQAYGRSTGRIFLF